MNEEPYSCEIILPWFLEINFEVLSERPLFFNELGLQVLASYCAV